VTTLIAVAFPDESTASAAAEDVRWVALDVATDADAVAVASRDRSGAFHLTTHHGAPGEARWGVFWVLLLATLFDRGPDRPDRGRDRAQPRIDAGDDAAFRGHLRDMLAPGTSVLFLAVENRVSDEAVRELTRLGGVLVTWVLTVDAASIAQAALRGLTAPPAGARLWPEEGGHLSGPVLRPGQTCGSV
jgi:uncharacterized membrane protein